MSDAFFFLKYSFKEKTWHFTAVIYFRWWSSSLKFDLSRWKIQNSPKIVFQKMQSPDVFWVQTLGKAGQITPFRHRYCALSATRLTGTEGFWETFPFFSVSDCSFRQHRWKVEITIKMTQFLSLSHSRRPLPFFPVLFCFVMFIFHRDNPRHYTRSGGWLTENFLTDTFSRATPQTPRIGTLPHFLCSN